MVDKPEDEARGKCPVCGRPTAQQYRPFCSKRCADVDLSRWLRGTYAIPGEADDKVVDDGTPDPSANGEDKAGSGSR
jgi:endogenous inhibitor of DNA gyrase (YacG/DUF329 family)